MPSSWAVRTTSGGRPAGGRAHSPAGKGTAGDLVPRASSQAEPAWAAALAGARVVWVGMAVVMAVTVAVMAVMAVMAVRARAGVVKAGVVRAGARVARVAVVAEVAGAVAKVAAMAARTKHRS